MRRNAWIAAIAAGLFSAAALAQMGPGPGYGPGGYGPMGGPGMGAYGACGNQAEMFQSLGLTPQQRQQVATIMEESSARRIALMDEMHTLRAQGVRSGTPDYAALSALREKMATLARDRRDRIDAVLTAEQRDRLRAGPRGFFAGR